MLFKEETVIVQRPDECVRLNEDGESLIFVFQSFDQLPHDLARSNLTIDSQQAGLLDERGLVLPSQRKNATHLSLSHASLFLEEKLAEFSGLRTDLTCLIEEGLRHPGGIKNAVGLFHPHPPGPLAFDVTSEKRE